MQLQQQSIPLTFFSLKKKKIYKDTYVVVRDELIFLLLQMHVHVKSQKARKERKKNPNLQSHTHFVLVFNDTG